MEHNLQPRAVNVNIQKVFVSTASGCNNLKMKLGEKLKQARETAGYTQDALANLVGMRQQSLQKIESGKAKSSKFLSKIEKILDLPPGYFLYGAQSTLDLPQPLIAGIPLLRWETALNWPENKKEIIDKGLFENFSSKFILGGNCYILSLKDDLMESSNPEFPVFKKGSYVVIDPNKPHKNNDFVLLKKQGVKNLIFRQYKIDDAGYEYLKILKSEHPKPVISFSDDMNICGVVVAYFGFTL